MNKSRLFGICIFLLLALMGWLMWKKSWQEALGAAGGGVLGIGSYLLLERFVMSLGGQVRRVPLKVAAGLIAVGAAVLVLAFLSASALFVLLGYSCFVASLLVNTVWDAVHA